jgi:stage V sporulation protein G
MEEQTVIKVVRLFRRDDESSKLKAFADVAVHDFVIKGVRVFDGKNGLFVGMPQEKSKDGKWYEVFHPSTEKARQSLTEVVLAAYRDE